MKTIILSAAFALLVYCGLSFGGMLDDGGLISDPPKYLDGNLTIPGGIDANDLTVKDITATGNVELASLTVGGEAASTKPLTQTNVLYVSADMSSAQIQSAIDAFEASKAWAADEPGTVVFMPGKYVSLNLSLGSDHILIDASMPGVVLAGTITAVDSPTGVYIYLWDHPSGTYPASLSLVDYAEVY